VTEEQLQQALALLPHGREFRFLDRLTTLVPGKEGTATYKVRGDESFLRGHFPGNAILPGVILVEAAAQLAGVVGQSDPGIAPLANLKLTAVRGAKIIGTARPGETVTLSATVTGRMNHLIQASASADVNGRMVLETMITLSGEQS
jgi:3-hydroxyacyl-[acyl-carrier-protein] dehydratase